MKRSKHLQTLARARGLIVSGDPVGAATQLDMFMKSLVDGKVDMADRAPIETQLGELRALAAAALSGTRSAVDHINAIIEEARSLRTYDRSGRQLVANAAMTSAKRY